MASYVKHFNELTTLELYRLLKARVDVFVVEQACPYAEIDDKDLDAYHVWIEEDGKIAALCRVLKAGVSYPEVSIGRVLSIRRGQGYGARVFALGLQTARDIYQAKRVRIEAQYYAAGFYERFGFQIVSAPFYEDGIKHVEMLLDIG